MIACLKLFRLPFVFTAMADSAVGYLVSHRVAGREPQWWALALVALSSAGLYAFGMALNDIMDVEKDRVSAPGKVLPSGRISMRGAWIAALGALAVSGAAIATVPGATVLRLGIWAALLFFIVAYDTFLKFAMMMGLVRAFNVLLGVAATPFVGGAGGPGMEVVAALALASFVYATALTFASEQEREGGRPKVVPFAGFMAAVTLVAARSEVSILGEKGSLMGLYPAALLAVWLLWRALGARDRAHVKLFVRDGVGGILLLDAAMLMSAGLIVEGLVVAALVVPAALGVMVLRRV